MTKSRNISEMSDKELADAGVPYLVRGDDLEALGIDPAPYFRNGGCMLDRNKDAALIERLRSMNEQHGTVQ